MTKTEKVMAEFCALCRARQPLFWVPSMEERRLERAIIDAATGPAGHRYEPVFWDCAAGLTDCKGDTIDANTDPVAILDRIRTDPTRRLYVLRDYDRELNNLTIRMLRNLARDLTRTPLNEARAVVITSTDGRPPSQIDAHAVTLDFPLPEREEVSAILDTVCASRPDLSEQLVNGAREKTVDAALGMFEQRISTAYAKSIVMNKGKLSHLDVNESKKREVNADTGLRVIDPDPRGFGAVGGLDRLKEWLTQRAEAFTKDAREYGLPAPRGILAVGWPGTGKSLIAKCTAAAWQIPLLAGDANDCKGSLVGESEKNFARLLDTAEAQAPCVLLLDEGEKMFAGATGGGNDSGVSAGILGKFLTWQQERTAPVFVVITTNDIQALPPELYRVGRIDKVFFVDLPTRRDRAEVIRVTLERFNRPEDIDLDAIAAATDGFSGAELAALVPDAMFAAFADGRRPVTTADILEAAQQVVPLSKTAAERLAALRDWAKGRAIPAATPEARTAREARDLDISSLDDDGTLEEILNRR
jgi:ATP-dependent 26S proteasome regulatory subunit